MSWLRWGGSLVAGLTVASGCRDTSFGPGVRFFHVATASITSDTAADQSVTYIVTLRVTDDRGATVSAANMRYAVNHGTLDDAASNSSPMGLAQVLWRFTVEERTRFGSACADNTALEASCTPSRTTVLTF
jgi:hypothetical protein